MDMLRKEFLILNSISRKKDWRGILGRKPRYITISLASLNSTIIHFVKAIKLYDVISFEKFDITPIDYLLDAITNKIKAYFN